MFDSFAFASILQKYCKFVKENRRQLYLPLLVLTIGADKFWTFFFHRRSDRHFESFHTYYSQSAACWTVKGRKMGVDVIPEQMQVGPFEVESRSRHGAAVDWSYLYNRVRIQTSFHSVADAVAHINNSVFWLWWGNGKKDPILNGHVHGNQLACIGIKRWNCSSSSGVCRLCRSLPFRNSRKRETQIHVGHRHYFSAFWLSNFLVVQESGLVLQNCSLYYKFSTCTCNL